MNSFNIKTSFNFVIINKAYKRPSAPAILLYNPFAAIHIFHHFADLADPAFAIDQMRMMRALFARLDTLAIRTAHEFYRMIAGIVDAALIVFVHSGRRTLLH